MASNSSYQLLTTELDEADDAPAVVVASSSQDVESSPPPPDNVGLSSNTNTLPPPPYVDDGSACSLGPEGSHELPPQYVDVVKLPTYHESEEQEEQENEDDGTENNEPTSRWFFWFSPAVSMRGSMQGPGEHLETGSDAAFMFSFLLALIFNWLGFLLSYCFTRSLASYYGAISGFGISLVKWAFIARRSEFSRQFMAENPWFCYAFVLFGWVIFMRGIFAYIQMKRMSYRST